MDRRELEAVLPHRGGMLLVDEVVKNPDGSVTGRYAVRGGEWFFDGHFPGKPVVPGVILCEMLAQSCCLLVEEELKGRVPLFTGLERVKLRQLVVPGDIVEFHCTPLRKRDPLYAASGVGSVSGKLCVSGELTFMLIPAN
jgi:3-hydroxyacyl-[acyl-carrier-protein] dehydratase